LNPPPSSGHSFFSSANRNGFTRPPGRRETPFVSPFPSPFLMSIVLFPPLFLGDGGGRKEVSFFSQFDFLLSKKTGEISPIPPSGRSFPSFHVERRRFFYKSPFFFREPGRNRGISLFHREIEIFRLPLSFFDDNVDRASFPPRSTFVISPFLISAMAFYDNDYGLLLPFMQLLRGERGGRFLPPVQIDSSDSMRRLLGKKPLLSPFPQNHLPSF